MKSNPAPALVRTVPSLLVALTLTATAADTFNPSINGPVFSLLPEPGGTFLVAGSFSNNPPHNFGHALSRLDAAGRGLGDFHPRISNGLVYAVALLPDGTLQAGGQFSARFDEQAQPVLNSLVQLSATGSLLPTFQIQNSVPIYPLAPQADGKVLIGGSFTALDGVPRTMLARYLPDSGLDGTFAPAVSDPVLSIAVQPDGQILVGGMFTTLGGQARNRIGRLSALGTLDMTFNPNANGTVQCLLVQPDGKILVGGSFITLGGLTRNRLGRLHPDGSPDGSFNPNANGNVHTMALQADGKILVGGEFTMLGGQTRNRLARLNPDGSLDTNFTAGANSVVYSLALQEDGAVLVGGNFTVLDGQSRVRAGRVANPDSPTQDILLDGATLTWLRGGSLPEVWRAEAEAWSGAGWTNLGFGAQISGGWQWTGLSLPPDCRLRLRGHAKGGRFCASTWPSEALGGPLMVTRQPAGRTNLASTPAVFEASVAGSGPIVYRWQKDGVPVADGPNVTGAGTPMLTLSSVLGADAGSYALVASNNFSVVTSAVAALTVIEPVIASQPTNVALWSGGSASFSVSALGTPPLRYQWWQDDSPVSGATNTSLNYDPVELANAGAYRVVVSSAFGSVTSSVATLAVWEAVRIVVPPVSVTNYSATPCSLSVTASGTPPLIYLWRKEGTAIPGATSSSLVFTGPVCTDAGSYDVVITNLFGSVTSSPVNLVTLLPCFLSLPGSLLRNVGESATFSASVNGVPPLQYAWRKDGVPIAGATGTSLTLTNLQASDAAGYDWLAADSNGAVTSRVAVLAVNTLFPDSFDPMRDTGSPTINAVAPLSDGRVLVAGTFARVKGGVTTNLAMLHPDGSPDDTFSPSANLPVNCLALEPGGTVLVGGNFTSLGGQTRNRLARLNPDGSLDTAFNPNVNGPVNCLALQPDGAILFGGSFDTVAGLGRTNLARLRPDGTLDPSFKPRASGAVNSLALQTDGAIVVGGSFTNLAGLARTNLGRLNSAGVADALFNPDANYEVRAVVVQPDGRILVGGRFTSLVGADRARFGRLQPDGSLDAGFDPRVGGTVNTLALLADGSVLVGGNFSSLGGQVRASLGRVDANGLVDVGFLAGANNDVYCLAPLPDGKLYVGGKFTQLCGKRRYGLGRLPSFGAVVEEPTFDGSELTWHRAGLAAEISQALAEAWDGTAWTNLGTGVRDGGAWRWSLPSVPLGTTFRVRGLVPSSGYQGAAWWTAAHGGLPLVPAPAAASARNAGESVTFSVRPIGSPPFGYLWLRDGLALGDGGNISGATGADLTLAALSCTDRGAYAVVVTNAYGSVTSLVASLTVRDPFIVSQPGSTTAGWGSNATFTVAAAGTPPFAYQWRRAGLAIPGATDTSLTITNVQPGDELGYDVTVSGGCGAATSIVAYLNHELAGCTPQQVLGLAPLPDGRLFAAGEINTVGGLSREGIVRYRPNGAPDASFNVHVGMVNYDVTLCYAVLVLPDHSVIIGGAFTNVAGMSPNRLVRLTPDGRIDPAFSPPNLNGQVLCLAQQADGKILAGGDFTQAGSLTRNRLVRLNPDGSVDSGFTASAGNTVLTIAVQPDGKILVGGLGGSLAIRFSSTGALDTSFAPNVSDQVNAIAVQPDGMILLGGRFTAVGGISRSRIARLYPNGSLDLTFSPQVQGLVYDTYVNSIVLQTDGRILVGGRFDTVDAQNYRMVVRLNANGSVDPSWNPGAHVVGLVVNSLAIQADGRVLAGGILEAVGDASRRNIVRLDNTDIAASSLAVDGSSAAWLRGGTGPEVWRTTFDRWNGSGWTNLGAGTRIAGGWQLGGLALPTNATVRAQGFAISGDDNCSSYIVEEGFGPPVVSIAPVNRTNFVGTTASLSAWVVGSGPVSYRWRKGGVELADGGNFSGTGTPNLSLANVQTSDSGWYSVVATNALGSVTSTDVYLAVVPLNLSASGPGLGWTTNRQFAFQLSGGAAWPVSVEASSNLLNWQGLSTFWLGPAPAVFSDSTATNYPVRAYRAAPVP
jgi:uncharacterized delta-60 repeat protein